MAIVLAGGDGKRLLPLTQVISGDDRPKQFCALVDSETLLERTRKRAERSVAPERTLFALTAIHSRFYQRESGIRPSQRIIQPSNKGTAVPIVYGLLSIAKLDPDAVVAVLPSDHHYSNERAFTAALDAAFETAQQIGSVVLLGSPAHGAETEYGWIELGQPADIAANQAFRIRRFCEKPSAMVAQHLFEQGALWNTFVMVGRVHEFLEMVGAARTGLQKAFPQDHLWSGSEVHLQDWLYARIYATDFSREILSTQAERLIAMQLSHTDWNDLGHPERVLDVLQASGQNPWWVKEWHTMKRPPRDGCADRGIRRRLAEVTARWR